MAEQNPSQLKAQKIVLSEDLDDKVFLEETLHVYLHRINESDDYDCLTSVSKILNTVLYDDFDAQQASMKRQTSMPDINKLFSNELVRSEAVLAQWNYNAKFGTFVHAIIEKFLLGADIETSIDETCELYDPNTSVNKSWSYETVRQYFVEKFNQQKLAWDLKNRLGQFKRVYDNFLAHYEFCAAEYIVFDLDTKIAGCIDSLFWSDREQRKVVIVDWKTNYDMATYGVLVKNLRSPFYKMKKSKLNRYQCQLHLYAAMLEKNYDVTVQDCFIVHMGPGGSYAIYETLPYTKCKCYSEIF